MQRILIFLAAVVNVEAFVVPAPGRFPTTLGLSASYLDSLSPPKPISFIIDEEQFLQGQDFPIKPEDLISLAKEIVAVKDYGLVADTFFAEDFSFIGPVVGPLTKEQFVSALDGFDVYSVFPDLNPQYYGFTVDPLEPGRVWAFSRAVGSNPETGLSFQTPPQGISYTFNSEGKVTKLTIGAVLDRTEGNTGGLGGLFGPLYAIGKGLPFPEAQPWKPSKRYRMFNTITRFLSKLKK